MFFSGLFAKNKSILGVDIGTSNIKIAQISHGEKVVLDTYGMVNTSYQLGGKNDDIAVEQMAKLLKQLIVKAGVTTSRCMISLPNSAVFTSVITLPKMNEKDLGTAVEFEAKKYVPLALSDIGLSLSSIEDSKHGREQLKILITAVPTQLT